MNIIEMYWDPNGIKGGKRGCWRARLASDHSIHNAGRTKKSAIRNFLLTARSLGESGVRSNYKIVHI